MSLLLAVEVLIVILSDWGLIEAVGFEHLLLGQSIVSVLVRGRYSDRR